MNVIVMRIKSFLNLLRGCERAVFVVVLASLLNQT